MNCKHHCWHLTDKYPIPLYPDDNTKIELICCWCGKKETVKHEDNLEWEKKQHGKYANGD